MNHIALRPEIHYLAGPYSHPDRNVRILRFHQLSLAAGVLMRKGLVVYSPISHTHPVAEMLDLPKDWAFWEKQDVPFLAAAKQLIVLTLDGWRESRGVTAEMQMAKRMGVPVEYLAPGEVPGLQQLAELPPAHDGSGDYHRGFADGWRERGAVVP